MLLFMSLEESKCVNVCLFVELFVFKQSGNVEVCYSVTCASLSSHALSLIHI